jgi:hypothetical protein
LGLLLLTITVPNRITPLHPHPLIKSTLDYNCKTTEWSCAGCQSDQARQEKNWPRFQCSQCEVNYCSNCIKYEIFGIWKVN